MPRQAYGCITPGPKARDFPGDIPRRHAQRKTRRIRCLARPTGESHQARKRGTSRETSLDGMRYIFSSGHAKSRSRVGYCPPATCHGTADTDAAPAGSNWVSHSPPHAPTRYPPPKVLVHTHTDTPEKDTETSRRDPNDCSLVVAQQAAAVSRKCSPQGHSPSTLTHTSKRTLRWWNTPITTTYPYLLTGNSLPNTNV